MKGYCAYHVVMVSCGTFCRMHVQHRVTHHGWRLETLLRSCRAEANAEGADSDWNKTPIGAIAKGAVHDVKEYGVVCDLSANPDVVGLAATHQVCSCEKHYKPC